MTYKYITLILIFIIIFLSCGCNLDTESQAQIEVKPKPPIPDNNDDENELFKKNIIYIKSDKDYNEIINDFMENPENSVILYFWADWCPPCKEISRKKTIETLAKKYKKNKVFFLKIEDKCIQTLRTFRVSVLPTMVIGREKLTGSNGITVDNVSLILNNKLKELKNGNSE